MQNDYPTLHIIDKAWAEIDDNYLLLQKYARSIPISRRKFPIAIQRAILRYKGKILRSDGQSWLIPFCCHLVFEPSNRWFGTYIENNDDGWPRHRSYTIERLIYLDLARQFENLGINVWALAD